MAETCAVAFGRYLRTLRERRGLSLDDVASLSRSFADPIGKSYLSRCENGRVRLALSKMIPLSRVYEVPPEVLVERLELDMELDKVGAPSTEGRSFLELTKLGRNSIICGNLWQAYGALRDAVHVAHNSDSSGCTEHQKELLTRALINFGTAAANLGRPALALHELEFVRDTIGLTPRDLPFFLERLARTYRALDRLDAAKTCADDAIAEATRHSSTEFLGHCYTTRARVAYSAHDLDLAIAFYQRAFQEFRDSGERHECTTVLLNLAQIYFDTQRLASARRALEAARRSAASHQQGRAQALIQILSGEIELCANRPREAAAHWRAAVDIAKRLNDKVLRFKAEFLLYKQAVLVGNQLATSVIERKLRRTSAWIREPIEELGEFRRMARSETRAQRRVPASQRPVSSSRNE